MGTDAPFHTHIYYSADQRDAAARQAQFGGQKVRSAAIALIRY
jgi:hypothetical protein